MEADLIRWLRRRLPQDPRLRVGPGDDAAVLSWVGRRDCVVTTDMLADGIDFELEKTDPRRVGRKALAVNLSDLAAMAAQPVAVFISVTLPRPNARDLAVALFEGLLPLAEEFDIAIAGGDTNTWDGPLVINITALGEVTARGPLLRTGARPGDSILVTGSFGGSILGRHFDFVPRVREALKLNAQFTLHAGTDVSDGLSLDLWHLVEESGCGAVLECDRIPISPAAQQLAQSAPGKGTALDHALGDGEDFELILAVPREEADRILAAQPVDVPITRIGYFTSELGLWASTADGSRQILKPRGYEHS